MEWMEIGGEWGEVVGVEYGGVHKTYLFRTCFGPVVLNPVKLMWRIVDG